METALPAAQARLEQLDAPPLSLVQLFWRRFRRHRVAVAGVIVLLGLVAYAFGGGIFSDESYANRTDTGLRLRSPSGDHAFGTDTIGRDILARTVYGGQISLIIGLLAVAVELGIG
ncbi:MAG: ABC transporter permease, partial [Anaerolineales bacterium]